MRRQQVEILAPAGSFESMTAAIAAGADAVYIGGSRFGARAYADNLNEDRMLEAIDYAHLHGCHLYMTVNTLVKEGELDGLDDYLRPYYERGLDAVIVQDLGVFAYVRKHFPGLPIHASTQMTITGAYGAKALKELGASRIVTARELSLEEIRHIHETVDVEIESFVHGALCYCYSGQCLFSSLVGGRSGNRGRCAQPCRLPYDVKRDGQVLNKGNEKYVLSLKDLCTLDIIPDMIEAGVFSMKIEGRMKSPRYTAGVVSIYRKYVDRYLERGRKGYRVEEADRKALLELFDRGGFTEGYYTQHNGADMVAKKEKPAFRQGNEELFRYLDETYVLKKQQETISGSVVMREGEPARMVLCLGEIKVSVEGSVVQRAMNQPITAEKLEKQMRKTGNTPFVFEKLDVTVEGAGFLPVQALNELRRSGMERLEEEILKKYRRDSGSQDVAGTEMPVTSKQPEGIRTPELHVLLGNPKALNIVLPNPDVTEIMVESDTFPPENWKDTVKRCHEAGKRCVLALPPIFRTEAIQYFNRNLEALRQAEFDGLLVRALEEVEYLREKGMDTAWIADHNLYTFNHLAAELMTEQGAARLTLPLELNSRELEETGCGGRELVAYGYLPMMISAQCIRKTVEGCSKKPELLMLKDRTGKELPVQNHCVFCYNTIYNISPLSLLGQESLVGRLAPGSIRLQFTTETPELTGRIVKAYADSFLHGKTVESPIGEFTRGHMKRGVE
ncbi:MAG: U32 family peptidase [Hungatella hathewayi]|nr:U32 family peptidase [Hungatella hathewayi]